MVFPIKALEGVIDRYGNLIYYNENNQINEIIKTKDALISEQGGHRINLINYDSTIKAVSSTINLKNNIRLNGKMKLFMALLFFVLFILRIFFKNFVKNQSNKRNL